MDTIVSILPVDLQSVHSAFRKLRARRIVVFSLLSRFQKYLERIHCAQADALPPDLPL